MTGFIWSFLLQAINRCQSQLPLGSGEFGVLLLVSAHDHRNFALLIFTHALLLGVWENAWVGSIVLKILKLTYLVQLMLQTPWEAICESPSSHVLTQTSCHKISHETWHSKHNKHENINFNNTRLTGLHSNCWYFSFQNQNSWDKCAPVGPHSHPFHAVSPKQNAITEKRLWSAS